MKLSVLSVVLVAGFLAMWVGLAVAAIGFKGDLYSGWDSELGRYVDSSGNVNYRAWKSDQARLDSFLQAAGKVTAQEYSQMSKEQKLSLWINIYNAFTVKQILNHYPIGRSGLNLYPENSIRQIAGVWDKIRISAAGRSVTLNEIENKLLRA